MEVALIAMAVAVVAALAFMVYAGVRMTKLGKLLERSTAQRDEEEFREALSKAARKPVLTGRDRLGELRKHRPVAPTKRPADLPAAKRRRPGPGDDHRRGG